MNEKNGTWSCVFLMREQILCHIYMHPVCEAAEISRVTMTLMKDCFDSVAAGGYLDATLLWNNALHDALRFSGKRLPQLCFLPSKYVK